MITWRRRLPAGLRPRLDPDERVVAWVWTGGGAGQVAVATTAGLYLPGSDRRLGWHEISKATWSGRVLAVTPAELVEQRAGYAVLADRPPVVVDVPDPGDLPQAVRTRVTRSVSYSSHHPVPGGGVWVVARRVPGVDGRRWAVRYDQRTDPNGPGVREATDGLVAAHRSVQDPAA